MDVLIGLAILAAILLAGYLATHHKPPQTASAKDLADTLAVSTSDAWEAVKRDLPDIVSSEVADLKEQLTKWKAIALKAQADYVDEKHASEARLAAVQAQIGALISGIGAQSASALIAPAVAAAQAEDVAAVKALAMQIQTKT